MSESVSVEDIQTLIQSGFADDTPKAERQSIFRWLDEYNRTYPSSLDVCIELLNTIDEVHVMAFAARMINEKIKDAWNTIGSDRRASLIQALFFFVRKFSMSDKSLLNNICMSLVQIALFTVPDQWESVILDFLSFAEVSLEDGIDTRYASILCITLFLEDILTSIYIDEKKRNILISFVIERESVILNVLSGVLLNDSNIKLKEQVLRCLAAWNYSTEILLSTPILNSIFELIVTTEVLVNDVADFLINLLESEKTPADLKLSIVTHCCDLKQYYMNIYSSGNMTLSRDLCRMFSTIGYFSTNEIIENPIIGKRYTDLMLECTKNKDHDASLQTFDFWSDLCVHIDENDCNDEFEEVIWKLILILRSLILWPSYTVIDTWTKTVLKEFKIFRREAAEVVGDCYDVIKEKCTDLLVEVITNDIEMQHNLMTSSIESSIFLIQSYVDLKIGEEEHPESNISNVYDLIPHFPNDSLLLNTVMKFIGKSAKWISLNERYFESSFTYIMDALVNSIHLSTTSQAFAKLCIWCRRFMVNNVEMIMKHLATIMNNMNYDQLEWILQGLCQIIYEIPYEQSRDLLLQLTSFPVQNLKQILENPDKSDIEDQAEEVKNNLRLFTNTCMHVIDPSKDQPSGLSYTTHHPLVDSLSNAWNYLYASAMIFHHMEEIISTITRILEYSIANLHTTHFPIFMEPFTKLIIDTFSLTPNQCLLKCVSFAVVVFKTTGNTVQIPEEVTNKNIELFSNVINSTTTKIFNMIEADKYSSVTLYKSYFDIMNKCVSNFPEIYYSIGLESTNMIITACVNSLYHFEETAVFRLIIEFIESFINQKNEFFQTVARDHAEDVLKALLVISSLQVIPAEVASASSLKIISLYKNLYVEDFKSLIYGILSSFQSQHLSQLEREQYFVVLFNATDFEELRQAQHHLTLKLRGVL